MDTVSPLELVVAVLFTSEVLEVWRHGSIFEDLRARLEAGFFGNPDSFIVRLLSCSFCLSVWVAGFSMLLLASRSYLWTGLGQTAVFLMYCGAVARLANILHDVVRPFSRTPGSKARKENSKQEV